MHQGCEAGIYLKASDDGKSLVIIKTTEDHDHEVSQLLYSYLPNQRKITPENKATGIGVDGSKGKRKNDTTQNNEQKWENCHSERFMKYSHYRQ